MTGVLVGRSASGCNEGGIWLGLWGPGWKTPESGGGGSPVELAAGLGPMVPAEAVEEQPGLFWLDFPLSTGVGEAAAVMRLEGRQAVLPLGARAGEFEVVLALDEGVPDPAVLAEARDRSETSLEAAQRAWRAGAFLLTDVSGEHGPRVVGEVRLRGALPPWVAVYDETWLTPMPVIADRFDDGGDLVLDFPVEPSLGGEHARIRINVALGEVVLPTDRVPQPEDRRLRLDPGEVDESERDRRIHDAEARADDLEAVWIAEKGVSLARAARSPDGSCRAPGQVDPGWPLLLAGYDVSVVAEDGACVVEVEPTVPQHLRRWRGRIGPEGVRRRN